MIALLRRLRSNDNLKAQHHLGKSSSFKAFNKGKSKGRARMSDHEEAITEEEIAGMEVPVNSKTSIKSPKNACMLV